MKRVIAALFLLVVFCAPVMAVTVIGDGSPENPYQVTSVEHLFILGSDPVLLTKHYILMNDIAFTPDTNPAHVFKKAVMAPTSTLAFSGSFDGNNHSISNTMFATYSWSDLGLFGFIQGTADKKAVIKNLKIANARFVTNSAISYCGALGARITHAQLTNCVVENTFIAAPEWSLYLGGLAGIMYDTEIVNCSVTGYQIDKKPFKASAVGGLVGRSENSTFEGCSSYGKIDSTVDLMENIGGLIGTLSGGAVTDCLAEVDFKFKKASSVGGLTGFIWSPAIVLNCRASGTVLVGDLSGAVGGLAGTNLATITDSSANVDIYCDGRVIAAGGLVGTNGGTVFRCSASGDITSPPTANQYTKDTCAGGLVGSLSFGGIEYCSAAGDLNLPGYSDVGGLVGRCSSSGKILNSYAAGNVTGWRALGGLLGGTNAYLDLLIIENCYSSGIVTASEPSSSVGGLLGQIYRPVEIKSAYFLESAGPDNGFGLPLTDEQMTHKANFAGWDFIGQSANGTEDIWGIHESIAYPKLWWEFTNAKPIAEANDITAYAWVDGFATVWLNGTGSRDEDGDALTYSWYNDANELIATGAEPNAVFGVGEYDVTLIVNDGIEDSEPNFCKVTVIEAAQAPAKMLPQTISLAGKKQAVKGRLAFADKPELDPAQPMLLLVGDLEIACATPVLELSTMDAKWYLTGQFDCAAMNSLPAGNMQIKLVTRLDSGQWVFGKDTIKIIKK